MNDYTLGRYFCNSAHHGLLHHILHDVVGRWPRTIYGGHHGGITGTKDGIALEFGVGSGESLNCIAEWLPVIGFDSFEGLPEDWRPGFDKGMFAYNFEEVQANVSPNALLCPGLFEDILPSYGWEGIKPIKLVHIDCDLYSSTKTVLENLPWDNLHRNKAVICFDEWHGYPGAQAHEQRAWREYVSENPIKWQVIGHGHQAWAVQIDG